MGFQKVSGERENLPVLLLLSAEALCFLYSTKSSNLSSPVEDEEDEEEGVDE